MQRFSYQCRRVGVLDEAGRRRHHAWMPNPHGLQHLGLVGGGGVHPSHHFGDGFDDRPVLTPGRWGPQPDQCIAVVVEGDTLDLGAAHVDPQSNRHGRSNYRVSSAMLSVPPAGTPRPTPH